MDAADTEAIETVVREHLEAAAADDLVRRANTSTGDLRAYAELLSRTTLLQQPPGSVSIDHIAVESVEGDVAKVELDATLSFANMQRHYTRAEVVRTADGWKVADVTRDGRSSRDEIFLDVHGEQQKNAVTVRVVAVVLQRAAIVLFADVVNETSEEIHSSDGPSIVAGGRQIANGFNESGPVDIASHATITIAFSWVNQTLPLDTVNIRFLINLYDADFDEIAYDIPVQLVS